MSAQMKYYLKNRSKIAIKQRIADKNRNKIYRGSVFELLGYKCVKCGFCDIRALQIDHINGDGKEERSSNPGARKYYKEMLKNISEKKSKYQILCANCNWIKRFENNEQFRIK